MGLIIFGASGFARECLTWVLQSKQYNVKGFYSDDAKRGDKIFDYNVVNALPKHWNAHQFLVAVGDPAVRKYLWDKALAIGLKPCQPIINPSTVFGINVSCGPGTIICPGTVITTNVKIGAGVVINLNCTIGHDCEIGNFATISPGVNVSGNCKIGEFAYIGTGATLREKLVIESESTVGMGAVVIKNVPKGEVWVGNPARPMQKSLPGTENLN
jgi:sugar O-acyltransferase (sialic acid O-acetyltransferase NeuD family)